MKQILSLLLVLFMASLSWAQVCPKCGRVHGVSAQSAGVQLVHSEGSGPQLTVAVQSALFRAKNRITGHSSVDLRSGFANGVGWATGNSRPATCFNSEPGAYAVAVGPDGQYYSTRVLYGQPSARARLLPRR